MSPYKVSISLKDSIVFNCFLQLYWNISSPVVWRFCQGLLGINHVLRSVIFKISKSSTIIMFKNPCSLVIFHYEIITLKITLKNFVTLKRHGIHTENYLQRKSQWQSRIILLKYFPCFVRKLKSHWKKIKSHWFFSTLLISFVSRFFSINVDFQCDFQYIYFIVFKSVIFKISKKVQQLLSFNRV